MTLDIPPDLLLPSEWRPTVSGKAELTLSAAAAGRGSALRMDFDFKGGGGFVVARRALNRTMPKEYAVHLRLRGRGTPNHLELKLIDAGGQNVWRYVERYMSFPANWSRLTVESRHIDFAWGPASGSSISDLGFVELAIVAGLGGKGTVWVSDLWIEDRTPKDVPTASASSALPGFEAPEALRDHGWKPRPDDPRPWIVVDCIQPRVLGGLTIDWLGDAPARGFRVRASNAGRRWRTLHAVGRAGGSQNNLYLPGLETRFIELQLEEPSAGARLRLQSFEFSRTMAAFLYRIAGTASRGWHPRWLHREQTLWTPIGTAAGTQCALMNEDGMVEAGQGSSSLEPMLRIEGRLVTWADVDSRQELLQGWIPVPSVVWDTGRWKLSIQAEAGTHVLRVRYRLENLTDQPLDAQLFVLVRPFQVTPPWQAYEGLGGIARILDLSWRDGGVRVNESSLIVPSESAGFGAMSFDDGFLAAQLAAGTLPDHTEAHDVLGLCTGALKFDLSVGPHASAERSVSRVAPAAAASIGEAAFDWSARLAVAQWAGNGWATDAIRAALTATAHILVTRHGPALQPGPRRYTRSWIRDGAMMSAALLRMGHADEVRQFIDWYAPNQREDGFVPCCIDGHGVDWLVEHDSHGELIALLADYQAFAPDAKYLEETWTFVVGAVGFIRDSLDQTGLLPVSVSHEGYLAQPVHSYWDDFWALRGLQDAVALARTRGQESLVREWAELAARFRSTLFASIEATRTQRTLAYLPGSIEWADFDPTATANALYLLDVPAELSRDAVDRTFDAYLADWRAKRRGEVVSKSYTPYEIRIIGALVRLGRRDAALELLRFFLADRRPPPWNQWPEIAWQDRKAPAHIGDLPHTWIAAEYVLALRSLFAYERETDRTLILGAGLAPDWIEGAGVRVHEMPTLYGSLSYSVRRSEAGTVRVEIAGGIAAKLVLRPPLAGPLRHVTVNGSPSARFDRDSVEVLEVPADVICMT